MAVTWSTGSIAMAIPLAPDGLGVGRLTYEGILSLLEHANGANLFNVYFISKLLLDLTECIAGLFIQPELKVNAFREKFQHYVASESKSQNTLFSESQPAS